MSEEREPYEVFPEGPGHATADWLVSLLASAALIIGLIALAWPAHAAENWCSQWADGFVTGYCWRKSECDYVPPVVCPAPQDGQTDGYVVGLKDGLSVGRGEE